MPAPGSVVAPFGIERVTLSAKGSIYRRRADEAGTYGGWRWECDAAHPAQFAHASHGLPDIAELAARITIAKAVERA